MNRVVAILMKRDGISESEAKRLIEETKEDILSCDSVFDADDILLANLGLEADYILDILE